MTSILEKTSDSEGLLVDEGGFKSIESSPANDLKKTIYDDLKSTGMEPMVIKNDKMPTQYLFDGEVPSGVAWQTWANHALSIYENPPGKDEGDKINKKTEAAKTFISLVELLLKRADVGMLTKELTGTAFELGEYREIMPELEEYLKWRVQEQESSNEENETEVTKPVNVEEGKKPKTDKKEEKDKKPLSPREEIIERADSIVDGLRHPGSNEQERLETTSNLRVELELLQRRYTDEDDKAAKVIIHEVAKRAKSGLKENRFKDKIIPIILSYEREVDRIARDKAADKKEKR